MIEPAATTTLPQGTYLTINDHRPLGYQGYAHLCRDRVGSAAEFSRLHPEITAEPHEITSDRGECYQLASWNDRQWHATPEAALAAIIALVLADVRGAA